MIKRAEAPKGYRLLGIGEKIKKGDIIYTYYWGGYWMQIPVEMIGQKHTATTKTIARKVKETKDA